MRLTRSNDDPKLLDDLERLARSHGDPEREPQPLAADAVPEDPAVGEAGDEIVDDDASPLDDPFVRKFVRASVHVKRYAPFYAGAAVWLLAMILIHPVGSNGAANTDGQFASSLGAAPRAGGAATASAVPAAAVEAAPVFDGFGGAPLASSGSSLSADSSFATSGSSSSSSASSSSFDSSPSSNSGSSSADTAPTFDDNSFATFESSSVDPISITASGYASRIGGTPLEQDPGQGGLPVASTGGNDEKRSFVRLAGDETVLRLQESTANAVRSDAAAVKACLITAAWQPKRAEALPGPAFDASNCATGLRDANGLWSFDLSSFGPLADIKGFALTPAAGTGSTFQLVLMPTPVPAPSS